MRISNKANGLIHRTIPKADKQKAFLAAFVASGGNITNAAQVVGMSLQQHYDWLKQEYDLQDTPYTDAYQEAKRKAAEVLESEAVRRAKDGFKRPVVSMGKVVHVPVIKDGKPVRVPVMKDGKVLKNGKEIIMQTLTEPLEEVVYSDSLMQTLLKGNLPEKYRERSEVFGAGGGPISITITSEDDKL